MKSVGTRGLFGSHEQCKIKQFCRSGRLLTTPGLQPVLRRAGSRTSEFKEITAPWQEATDELLAKSKELQGYSTLPIKKRAQTASPMVLGDVLWVLRWIAT